MSVCGVILAAGKGTRLQPFSAHRPKPSFPIGDRSLLHRAIAELRPYVEQLAVNVSGHPDWFAANVPDDVTVFHEGDEPLGTAGALVNMRSWIGDRHVVLLNADAVLFGSIAEFLAPVADGSPRVRVPSMPSPRSEGWASRLLVTVDWARPDFDGMWRFTGLSTLTPASVAALPNRAFDLYHDLWRGQLTNGDVQLVPYAGCAVDCGTPAGLLAANMIETGGHTVIEQGAVCDGVAERCVLLTGTHVRPDQRLRMCVVDRSTVVDVATAGAQHRSKRQP